jgi:hypothetical protein
MLESAMSLTEENAEVLRRFINEVITPPSA